MMMNDLKRILLKLSGEALAGDKDFGFDEALALAKSCGVNVLSHPPLKTL